MDKQNAKILFEILEEKVPNREVCRVASQQEIERIMAEVNAIIEEKKIEEQRIEITAEKLPREIVFEMVLYIISTTEWLGYEDDNISYNDKKFWNLEDKATRNFVNGIKMVFGIAKSEQLTSLKLEDFLAYAKSDAPGL